MENAPAHGVFVWNELNTRNIDAAKAFYSSTLGWSYEPFAEGRDYCIIKMGDTRVGGIFPLDGPEFEGIPDHWFAYVAVDDVDARAAAVERAGGTVLRAPFEVPGVGRIAVVRDSVGAVAGWITPRM